MKHRLPILVLALLAGCSRMEPQFKPRADFRKLIPEARVGVDAAMRGYFGTPTNMKIWEDLPLRHSGAVGEIVEPVTSDSGEITGVKVEWEEETWPVRPGQTIGWLNQTLKLAELKDQPVVGSYDPAEQVITFKAPLAEVPENGTRLAVAVGEVLHQGRFLYAEHCQHCHGVSGDGAGPTARYLNPLPRDYRDAMYKFTSTPYTHPPSRQDLARIVENGIPGTYMPSFKLLEPHEMDSIVEYVRWLSMRGQCEKLLIGEVAGKESVSESIVQELIDFLPGEAEAVVAGPWIEADTEEILIMPESERPAATPESIDIGRKIFASANAKCADCHGKSGLGDGPQTLAVEQNHTEPGLHDAWGAIVIPRNLRSGIYRGGRRPLDVYRRVAAGIKGTPMNGFKTNLYNLKSEELGLAGDEKDLAVWHLVNYVLSMPYEELELGQGLPGTGGNAAATPPATAATILPATVQETSSGSEE